MNSASAGAVTGSVAFSPSPLSGTYWNAVILGIRPASARNYILGGINNPATAQIFENATGSNGLIDFTGNLVSFKVYPEWWGASGTNSNLTTNTAAIQAAEHGAFGTGRVNGSGSGIYNKTLYFGSNFQINGTITFGTRTGSRSNAQTG